MSDSSPRWPGSNGSPGLDFSPRRPESRGGAGSDGLAARLNGKQGGTQGDSADSRPSDHESSARPSGSRPTPPPFEAGSQPSAAPAGPASSVQTPARSGEAASASEPAAEKAATPKDPEQRPTSHQSGQDPKLQESAASWAWQPLGAEPDASPSARTGGPGSTSEPATTIRPASGASAPAAAAVAGGAISGAAARAADQGKKASTTRRTTPSPATSTPSAATRRTGTRRTRKARLRLARLDPWSVMKTTFLFSIAFGIIVMVVAWVLWTVLAGSGALESLNQFMTTLIGQEGEQFDVENYVNGPRVLGAAAVLAAIDIVILTAVATLFAFLYNLAATVIGGLEVTLAED